MGTDHMAMVRSILYVDGFSVYYRLLKNTPYKWLNVKLLAETIVKNADIQRVRYFTARAEPRPNDPYIPARQDTYLRALLTIPSLTIHEGTFRSHDVMMPLTHPAPGGPFYAQVHRTDEKGSDVNLASFLLIDAYRGEFDQAIVLSNDSDLTTPIEHVVMELGLPVIVLAPEKSPSKQLRKVTTEQRPVRKGPLAACQFPQQLQAINGRTITKPDQW